MVIRRPGTRPCPFCGERIKTVAIRCRHCHADLTEVVPTAPGADEPPADEPIEAAPEPVSDAPDASDDGEDSHPGQPWLGRPSTTWVLAVALIAVAAIVAVVGWRTFAGDDSAAVDTAIGGALLDEQTRTDSLIAAADMAQRTFTYHHDSFDNDTDNARARMTEKFRTEYDGTMEQIRANTLQNKITSTATVVAAATVSADEDRADVLVFLNQVSTAEDVENAQVNQPALLVTVVRDGNDWLLSEVEALR